MNKQQNLIYKTTPILLTSLILCGCSSIQPIQNEAITEEVVEVEPPKDIDANYSISFFGDLLIHDTVYNAAKTGNTYDFTNHFIDIKDAFNDSDFVVANLEVPTAGNTDFSYSNYPAFNCPEQILDAIRDTLSVDLVTNATNHSLDKGYKGLVNTINFLDEAGIPHIGTYKDKESSEEIFMHEIDGGIKIAFLNYTYGTNGIPLPKDHPYSVNIIDKDKIVADAIKAEELGADFVIAKLHWSEEYRRDERQADRDLAKYLFENSPVNLIVGDHPHVVQNIEQMIVEKDEESKTGTVIYSLGNFISDQRDLYKNSGIIAKVNLYINKTNPDQTKVESIEYTPVYVDRNPGSAIKKYRVVDINKAIYDYENGLDSLISKKEYDEMIYSRNYYREKLIEDDFVSEKTIL